MVRNETAASGWDSRYVNIEKVRTYMYITRIISYWYAHLNPNPMHMKHRDLEVHVHHAHDA